MATEAISLERFAELRAEMDAGARRDDVLGRAGVTVDRWIAAQEVLLGQIGAEVDRGAFELMNRYSSTFLARQGAIAAAAAPRPVERAPLAAAPATSGEARPVAVHALPSYLVAEASAPAAPLPLAPPPPPPPRRSPLQATSMALDLPAGPSLPFQGGAARQSPPGPPKPSSAVKAKLGGTSPSVDLSPPSTPFGPAAAVDIGGFTLKQYASISAEVELAGERFPEVLSAHGLTAGSKAALDARWQTKFSQDGMAALEYLRLLGQEKTRLKASGPTAPIVPAAPAATLAPAKAPGLGGTSMSLDIGAAVAAALPFAGAAPDAGKATPPPAASAPAPKPKPVGSGTAFVPQDIVAKAAVPFAGGARPAAPTAPTGARAPDLTLQQYASLCAELAVYPERADAIRVKYRVGDPHLMAALERVWTERFAKDAALRADWQKQVDQFRSWLKTQPR